MSLKPMTAFQTLQDFHNEFVLPLPVPGNTTIGPPRHVLLTGASGFLGRYTLVELLERTRVRVTCLVRGESLEVARGKVLRALARAGMERESLPERVSVVRGDIEQVRLGLVAEEFERLAASVDSVVHGAAQVLWSVPYSYLRGSNVFGTREIVRFCATQRLKRLVFVSSIASRFSPVVSGIIDEQTDMRPYVHRMPMGYGQSKCVAEALAETLVELGAPVSVLRPQLIAGHSRTGAMNPDDFYARMLINAAQDRIAPELDCLMDCVAVDETARVVVVNLMEDPPGPEPRRLHLVGRDPATWGEAIATLNLFCPGVRMMPWETWLTRINVLAKNARHPLNPLRAFLLGRLFWDKSQRAPDQFLTRWQRRVDSRASERWMAERGLELTTFDGPQLELMLAELAQKGRVTMLRRFYALEHQYDPAAMAAQLVTWAAEARPGEGLDTVRSLRQSTDTGMVSRVASWRYGTQCRNAVAQVAAPAQPAGATLELFVKHTPSQGTVNLIGQALGELMSPEMGELMSRQMPLLDFDRPDERELAAYAGGPAASNGHAPRLYGAAPAAGEDGFMRLGLQCLPAQSLIEEARWTQPWDVEAAPELARALASWQARKATAPELRVFAAPAVGALRAAVPLWSGLAEASARVLRAHAPEALAHLQALVAKVNTHWSAYAALPQTFVHNDCNPRNLAIVADAGSPSGRHVCAYDWQLVTRGPAVRDLAEFLCFAIDPARVEEDLPVWLAAHRAALEAAGAPALAETVNARALGLALDDWLLRRLPLYGLYHLVRPQTFVAAVATNWWRLRQAADAMSKLADSTLFASH